MGKDEWTKKFSHVTHKIKSNFNNIKCCNDNYVGTITIDNNKICSDLWFCKNLRKIKKDEIIITEKSLNKFHKDKIIIIVLESPHIDEYNKSKFCIAPAPALGMTGCNLDRYFLDVIKEQHLTEGKYHVILANAIQYQCSLGYKPIIYRDRIWLNLWLCYDFDRNFIERLQKYKPDIIINLCTVGSHIIDGKKLKINKDYLKIVCDYNSYLTKIKSFNDKIALRDLTQNTVEEYIRKSNNSLKCFKGCHPSSWYKEKNRILKLA